MALGRQVRTYYYLNRWEMSKGVARMTADQWLVQIVTTLQEGSYRVIYVRAMPEGSVN